MPETSRTPIRTRSRGNAPRNTTSGMPPLPQDILAWVFWYVKPTERLTSCALVCKAWQDAVAAVMQTIFIPEVKQPRLNSLASWLAKQGQWVTRLQLSGRCSCESDERPALRQLQLPAGSRLRVLILQDLQLQLGPARGHAGVLQGLPSTLTKLSLGCRVRQRQEDVQFSSLSVLTGLQHLLLRVSYARTPSAVVRFPAGVLSQLVQLTSLSLHNMEVAASALRGLSALSGMVQLSIMPAGQGAPLAVAAVNAVAELQRLTQLELNRMNAVISNNTAPGFSRLTALEVLWLRSDTCSTRRSTKVRPSPAVHPEVLAGMHVLRDLSLFVLPIVGGAAGAALLLTLPVMQNANCLALCDAWGYLAPSAALQPQQFGALTSSTGLRSLTVNLCTLPEGACDAMFNRQLGRLSSLTLCGCELPVGSWAVIFNRQLPQLHSLALCDVINGHVTTVDLQRMVSSCPRLSRLSLQGALDSDTDLAALQQCQYLTSLEVSDVDDGQVYAVAELTILQELTVHDPNSVTLLGFWQLTALEQLDHLCIWGFTPAPGVATICELSLYNRAPYGEPSDVPGQVQDKFVSILRPILALYQGQLQQLPAGN